MTINNLHCSEFAFRPKPEEALIALTEAVPADGRIIIESTANGRGNYFHQVWGKAEHRASAYKSHFFVWWEDPGYALAGPALGELTASEQQLKGKHHLSDDQLRWRRPSLGSWPTTTGSASTRRSTTSPRTMSGLAAGRTLLCAKASSLADAQ